MVVVVVEDGFAVNVVPGVVDGLGVVPAPGGELVGAPPGRVVLLLNPPVVEVVVSPVVLAPPSPPPPTTHVQSLHFSGTQLFGTSVLQVDPSHTEPEAHSHRLRAPDLACAYVEPAEHRSAASTHEQSVQLAT